MVSFRPHTLRIVTQTEGTYDEHGNFTEGVRMLSDSIACRYEPNGKARTLTFGDGKGYMYDFIVYLSTSCPDIKFGDSVILYDQSGEPIGQFSVQGVQRSQLNTKIWV